MAEEGERATLVGVWDWASVKPQHPPIKKSNHHLILEFDYRIFSELGH